MSDTGTSNIGDPQSVVSWLCGLQSPPPSPVDRDIPTSPSNCFCPPESLTKRGQCDDMSQSPKKRKPNQQSDVISDALSEISLPPPSSDRVRPSSPPRELREIYRYAKPPLRFITTPDERTPPCVLDLYRKLQKSAAAVIPATLKVGDC